MACKAAQPCRRTTTDLTMFPLRPVAISIALITGASTWYCTDPRAVGGDRGMGLPWH
jgi:hypothetical protein